MSRDTQYAYGIALLATGDEICNGDILNTNAQQTAQQLFQQGMVVSNHMVVPDNIAQIEHAILFLLHHHHALIITGGLGPTSDDLTRFALSQALQRPLQFDTHTWDNIVSRLSKLGHPNPPESNRQQALFPEGSTIILNPHGTAAGCMIQHDQRWIFMLPGPPQECLPMLKTMVLPTLLTAGFKQTLYHDSWLLFGVSEGHIAEILDQLAKPFNCMTGYRLCYPYIEFKIQSNHEQDFASLKQLVEQAIVGYLISDGKQTASSELRKKLENYSEKLIIADQATGGLLETHLKTPLTTSHITFGNDQPHIQIDGLQEFWQQQATQKTSLILQINLNQRQETVSIDIPLRGDRVKLYAVEWICYQLNQIIFG